jgi:hypothetical protein
VIRRAFAHSCYEIERVSTSAGGAASTIEEGAEAAASADRAPRDLKPPKPPTNPLDLAKAIRHLAAGSPERAKLIDQFAKLSTHSCPPQCAPGAIVKGEADRVVLGKWADGGGYVGEASGNGGIWYQTPPDTYPILGKDAAWETNQAFLRQQMQSGVPKLEFTGMDIDAEMEKFASVPPESLPARVKEIQFLQDNAASYAYTQQGNSFVKLP